MRLLWTKSASPISKFIRLLTGEDCSHFCIVLYDGRPGEILFESNLLGTHPAFAKSALEKKEIVHEIKIALPTDEEDKVWDRIVQIYDDRKYDFMGAIYLGWRYALKRVFGVPLPNKNKWACSKRYFCSEIFEAIVGVQGVPTVPPSNGMNTPHSYWEYLK